MELEQIMKSKLEQQDYIDGNISIITTPPSSGGCSAVVNEVFTSNTDLLNRVLTITSKLEDRMKGMETIIAS
jgi:hypothetical protein